MIDSSKVADRIKQRPCEKCGEAVDPDSFVLTFYRGEFITLHEECRDFIHYAAKGPRITAQQIPPIRTLETVPTVVMIGGVPVRPIDDKWNDAQADIKTSAAAIAEACKSGPVYAMPDMFQIPAIDIRPVARRVNEIEKMAGDAMSLLGHIVATFRLERNRESISALGPVAVELLAIADRWGQQYDELLKS